jgi:hypothetical protein
MSLDSRDCTPGPSTSSGISLGKFKVIYHSGDITSPVAYRQYLNAPWSLDLMEINRPYKSTEYHRHVNLNKRYNIRMY